MSDTPNFALPLLAASQAQKHVTVNEALARLDALASPVVISAELGAPPTESGPGDAYIVATPSSDDWAGRDGEIAFWVNDGWSFAPPRPGWRVWLIATGVELTWTGASWIEGLLAGTPGGAVTQARVIVSDETFQAGASFATNLLIPNRAVVIGVTARVISDIGGGDVSGWSIGVAGAEDRYGAGLGLSAGSFANGVTGSTVAYYGDTPLAITAEGGAFDGVGAARIAVHFLSISPPDVI